MESVIGLDRSGKELFALSTNNGQPLYVKEVGDFSNGRSFIRVSDKLSQESWGLIDTRGTWVVKPTDEWAPVADFHNGLAKVKMAVDGAFGYMDRAGKIVYKE